LAGGRAISLKPVPIEITMYLLAKEFGWTPNQIKYADYKDIQGICNVLFTYNRIKNQKEANKSK
jgi:hypothetical protein